MDLTPYVDSLRRQLVGAAEPAGDDVRSVAERLVAALDPAARLTMLEALSAAADEITRDLAPGSVEVRLRGREPGFVVVPPPFGDQADSDAIEVPRVVPSPPAGAEGDEATMVRINLRLSDHLKGRVEAAADSEGLSVNAWLVRAAAAALERGGSQRSERRRAPRGGESFTGWVR